VPGGRRRLGGLASGGHGRPLPVYLSTLRLAADRLRRRDPTLAADTDQARVLRSVLMKPEHEGYVDALHREVLRIAAGLPA
jgi:hypothetical protein